MVVEEGAVVALAGVPVEQTADGWWVELRIPIKSPGDIQDQHRILVQAVEISGGLQNLVGLIQRHPLGWFVLDATEPSDQIAPGTKVAVAGRVSGSVLDLAAPLNVEGAVSPRQLHLAGDALPPPGDHVVVGVIRVEGQRTVLDTRVNLAARTADDGFTRQRQPRVAVAFPAPLMRGLKAPPGVFVLRSRQA